MASLSLWSRLLRCAWAALLRGKAMAVGAAIPSAFALLLTGVPRATAGTPVPSTLWPHSNAETRARNEAARALADGEAALLQALQSTATGWQAAGLRAKLVTGALSRFRAATIADPTFAEAYFQLGNLLAIIHLECDSAGPNNIGWCKRHRPLPEAETLELVAAFETFARLSPNDSRVDAARASAAIALTKLATPSSLTQAARLYQEMLTAAGDQSTSVMRANYAEVLMMSGALQRAIAMYEQVAAQTGDTATVLGLAVALDRANERGRARSLIRALAPANLQTWADNVARGSTFYVPSGEFHYYLALVAEANREFGTALTHWDAFIASGAHPRYQTSAKRNRALAARLAASMPPPTSVTPRNPAIVGPGLP